MTHDERPIPASGLCQEAQPLVAFVVNPVAGKGRSAQIWGDISRRLQNAGARFNVYLTEKKGDGRAKAAQAVRDGAKRIVSVGGDGTMHEVVNSIHGTGVELAVVPTGTGNDFARTADIPLDPFEAASLALRGTAKPIDLGSVCGEVFVNVAGVGFDAEVANDTNNRNLIINGTITYLVSVLTMLRRYRCAEVRLAIDGQEIRQRVLLVAVGNGKFYGGGMKIAPGAIIDDGLFDIVVAGDLTKFETIVTLPKVYSGRHIEHPKASLYRGKRITIESNEKLFVHADGEIVGTTPATFEVLRSALKVVR